MKEPESNQQRQKRTYINNIVNDPTQRRIFNHLLDQAVNYPRGKYGVPLKPLKKRDKRKPFYTLHITASTDNNDLVPLVAVLMDGLKRNPCNLNSSDKQQAAQSFADHIFRSKYRSRRIYAYGAHSGIFHALLRHYAPHWIKMGYVIMPIATGTQVKAIRIRNKRDNWTLIDAQGATGSDHLSIDEFIDTYGSATDKDDKYLSGLHNALLAYEDLTLKWFGEPLGITIAASAMRAARRSMFPDEYKWRPDPLMVAMCRTGGAYRGGYAIGEPFRGHAYRVDMNKAYTSALSEELPQKVTFAMAGDMGEEQAGIYVCAISGYGSMPIYISRWEDKQDRFSVGYWRGGEAYTILPSAEIDGIRALGYQVRAGYGYKYLSTMSLNNYVDKIQNILNEYDRGTPEHDTAKRYGVAVYGKFAQRNEVIDIAYSEYRISEKWFPFLTIEGDEVPNLWVSQKKVYRPHQQVDWAAHITAHVRSRLYMEIARSIADGGRIVHADTDGFITTKKPQISNLYNDNEIGAWRFDTEGEYTSIYGAKGYSYGDDVRTAGAWSMTPEMVELVARGEDIIVKGKKLASPFSGEAMYHELTRTIRRTA